MYLHSIYPYSLPPEIVSDVTTDLGEVRC
uniref:Uncharacterized protein n=1 Tax=Arundo donax TaxID=35708 RepID=A0A0A9HRD2_ARUDO